MLAFAARRGRRARLARPSSSRASTSPTPTPSSSTAPTRSAWPSSTSCAAGSGRSSRRAYAYLLYRRKAALTDIARKRLAGHLQRLRARRRLPDRPARPRDPRRRQPPRRRAARPHGRRRLRPLHAHAGRGRGGGEGRARGPRAAHTLERRPRSTCRSTPTCPTTTCPRSRRSWSCTGGWAGSSATTGSRRSAPSCSIATAPCPGPVERLLEVSRLRYRAEEAGLISVAREEWPAGVALRSRLVAGGHHARARATFGGRPAARAAGPRQVRLQPGARAAASRWRSRLAADAGHGRSTGRRHARGLSGAV